MANSTTGISCSIILRAITQRGRYIRNLAVFLLVWAMQAAVTALFFKCPCYEVTPGNDVPYRRFTYSVLWFVVPAFVLWFMSLLLLDRLWRCLIGCRNRPRPYPNQGCHCFWKTIGESLLAPLSWLFLVFIDGTFLECSMAYTPSNCLDTTNITPANLEAILDKNTEARWKSAVIGLSLALVMISLYFLVLVCYQCCSSTSYYQSKYAEHIQNIEREAFADAAREDNYPVFKARWKALFRYGTEQDWTDASLLPFPTPVKKKSGFVHSYFQGMRFGAEQAFLDIADPLPSYRAVTRDDVYEIKENGVSPTQHQHHISEKESPSHQDLQRKNKPTHQKKKHPVRKVQVTSPQITDQEENED